MYRAKQPIHSHAHGKTFAAGAQITERDFPPHAIRAMLRDGVVEDLRQPEPAAEDSAPPVEETQATPERQDKRGRNG